MTCHGTIKWFPPSHHLLVHPDSVANNDYRNRVSGGPIRSSYLSRLPTIPRNISSIWTMVSCSL